MLDTIAGFGDVYSDIGEFGVAQHIQLAEILKDSKATWMLSYGDNALVRELYKGFPIREAKVLYSGLGNAGENQHEADELIITNYEPTEAQGGLFAPPVDLIFKHKLSPLEAVFIKCTTESKGLFDGLSLGTKSNFCQTMW